MLTEFFQIIKQNLFLIFLIILIALLSFQLGRISKRAGQPIRIEKASIQEIFNEQNANMRIDPSSRTQGVHYGAGVNDANRGVEKIDFRVVASKKSTSGKYHFSWCPGAKQIKEENKIFFNSEKEAISAGYALAGNCFK